MRDITKKLVDFSFENTSKTTLLNQVSSELCELSASINALIVAQEEGQREGQRISELCEEIADVENMLYQLRRYCSETLFIPDDVIKEIQQSKAERRFDHLITNMS